MNKLKFSTYRPFLRTKFNLFLPPPTHTHTHTHTHTSSSSSHCSHSLQLPGPLLTLCANPDSPHFAAVQLTDGTVLKYVSHESGGTASHGCSLKVGEAGEPSGQPSLVPWCLHDGRKVTFPDTCCEHVAMATFKDEVLLTSSNSVNSFEFCLLIHVN